MTRPFTTAFRQVRVFVASPSDVRAERDVAAHVIDELRRVFCILGLDVQLIRWETDVVPGAGEDAQDVINEQTGPYDILLGIMWKRFGTPTRRADSGTSEEYDRAYRSFLRVGRPHIMFYFCTTPFFSTNRSEMEQFLKVLAFRNRLDEDGILYWAFENALDFERSVREHLAKKILKQWYGAPNRGGRVVLVTAPPTTQQHELFCFVGDTALHVPGEIPCLSLVAAFSFIVSGWQAHAQREPTARSNTIDIGLDSWFETHMDGEWRVALSRTSVYDDSLALLCFLGEHSATGSADSLRRAKLIGEALVYASQHDRTFDDGRLRSSYSAGDLTLPPNWNGNGQPRTPATLGFHNEDPHTSFDFNDDRDGIWIEGTAQMAAAFARASGFGDGMGIAADSDGGISTDCAHAALFDAKLSAYSEDLPTPTDSRPIPVLATVEGRAVAAMVQDLLRTGGCKPWSIWENVLPGENWVSSLHNVARKADMCILVWSRGCNEQWLARQVAVVGQLKLITVRADDSPVPDLLKNGGVFDLSSPADEERLLQFVRDRCGDVPWKP